MPAYGMGKTAAVLPHLHSFVDVMERKRHKYSGSDLKMVYGKDHEFLVLLAVSPCSLSKTFLSSFNNIYASSAS